MTTGRYSLSSASNPTFRTKTRRVSAQLMGAGSLASSDNSRRVASEDCAIIHHTRSDNRMSKAAAWMWHTRGIGEVAVLPTKQQPLVNATTCDSSDEIRGRKLQPSRFKREAHVMGSAPGDQSRSISSAADLNYAACQSAKVSTVSDAGAAHATHIGAKQNREGRLFKGNTSLYDEFELSWLQELLETPTDRHSKLLSRAQPCSRAASSPIHASNHHIRPLSALRKLLKRFYTSVVQGNAPNSASFDQTGPSTGKPFSVQHVFHHQHHHYYHYHALDLAAHGDHPPIPTSLQAFPRRRRHSESFSQARRTLIG